MHTNKKNINFEIVVNKGIEIGLIIFAIGSPFSISLAQIGFIGALLFWIAKLFGVKKTKIKGTFLDIFLLVFLIGTLLSSFFSIDIIKSLKASRPLWHISMLYLLFNNTDLNQGKKLLKILLIFSTLIGLYGIFQSLTGIDFFGNKVGSYGRHIYGAVGGFGLHLTYGGYQMMTALILLSIVMYGLKNFNKKNKILITISTFIVILSVILSFARTAWFGLIAGCIILGIIAFFLKSKKPILVVLGIFILMIILFISSQGIRIRVNRMGEEIFVCFEDIAAERLGNRELGDSGSVWCHGWHGHCS